MPQLPMVVGFGVKFQHNVADPIRIEGSFSYFSDQNRGNRFDGWTFNVNEHYLFSLSDKIALYPLVGLGYAEFKYTVSGGGANIHTAWSEVRSRGNFTFNAGAGVDFQLSKTWTLSFETKIIFMVGSGVSLNPFTPRVGLAYNF